jgi:hypothetical protein
MRWLRDVRRATSSSPGAEPLPAKALVAIRNTVS